MKKILLILLVLIFLLTFLLFKSNTDISRVSEEDITIFVEENVEMLNKIKDIAFENKEILQLSPARRIWCYLNGEKDKVIDSDQEISILYDELLGEIRVVGIYEDTLKNDKRTNSYPAIIFHIHNKQSELTYQIVGFMYVDTKETLDLNQYKGNNLAHIIDKWYYFELSPLT